MSELGDLAIDRVQAKHITSYLVWRRAHRLREDLPRPARVDGEEFAVGRTPVPLNNRTLQKDRAVLHRIFAIAERLELRDGNPVARVPPPKADGRDPVILSDDEYERLLTACGPASERPMLYLYALTLGETGVRCESEALFLRWEHVDLDGGFVWIASGENGHRTKSGKGRWVPMMPGLVTAMREHFARFRFAGSPWVFHHMSTRRHYKAGERIHSLRAAFKNAAHRAKLSAAFHAHDLRHRRVTTWLGEGANPVHVKEAMGHSDLRTTMVYTHLAREHLRALVGSPARHAPAQAGVVGE